MQTFDENVISHKPFSGYCEVRVFAWCYVTRYLTFGVKTTLVFLSVVHTRRKYCFLAKKLFPFVVVTYDRNHSMWATRIR